MKTKKVMRYHDYLKQINTIKKRMEKRILKYPYHCNKCKLDFKLEELYCIIELQTYTEKDHIKNVCCLIDRISTQLCCPHYYKDIISRCANYSWRILVRNVELPYIVETHDYWKKTLKPVKITQEIIDFNKRISKNLFNILEFISTTDVMKKIQEHEYKKNGLKLSKDGKELSK
jgi:hypothetical protein